MHIDPGLSRVVGHGCVDAGDLISIHQLAGARQERGVDVLVERSG